MPGVMAAAWIASVATYFLAGAIGLACTWLFHGIPAPLRNAAPDGLGPTFRAGFRASATWPWTWKRWTDG